MSFLTALGVILGGDFIGGSNNTVSSGSSSGGTANGNTSQNNGIIGGILSGLNIGGGIRDIIEGGFDFTCFNSTVTSGVARSWMEADFPAIMQYSGLNVQVSANSLNKASAYLAFYAAAARRWAPKMRKCSRKSLERIAQCADDMMRNILNQVGGNAIPIGTRTEKVALPFSPKATEEFRNFSHDITYPIYQVNGHSDGHTSVGYEYDENGNLVPKREFISNGTMIGFGALALVGTVFLKGAENNKKSKKRKFR